MVLKLKDFLLKNLEFVQFAKKRIRPLKKGEITFTLIGGENLF